MTNWIIIGLMLLTLLILVNGTDHSYRNRYQPRPKIDPPPPR